MRGLVVSSTALSVGTAAAQLLTMIAYMLAARTLAPAHFGDVVALIGVATLIATIADFGINAVSIRQLAETPDNAGVYAKTLSAKLALAVLLGGSWVIASAVLPSLGGARSEATTVCLLGVYLALNVISTTLSVPLLSQQRMGLVAIGSVLEKSTALVVTGVALATSAMKLESLAYGLVAGGMVAVAFYARLVGPEMRALRMPHTWDLVELWRVSRRFGLSTLAVQMQRADVALVGVVAGSTASGVFAVAARLTNPLGILPTSMSTALFPRVASTGHSPSALREILKMILLMLGLMAALLGSLFVTADRIVPLLLGNAYMSSIPVLRVYLCAMLVASANQPLAVYLQATHHERYVARTVMAAALVGLSGVAVGAAFAGAFGAAFGFAFQQGVIFIALSAAIRASLHLEGLPVNVDGESAHAHS